ncbi:FHA domain-containing protein [Chloroflexota bacterium]
MQLVTAAGQTCELRIGVNSVGRGMDNDIVLADGSMSRRHAELRWDGQRCVVVDLGSTNGTFLQGQRMVPHQAQTVSPGTPLSFGPTMVVALADDAVDMATVHAGPGSPPPAAPLPQAPVARQSSPGTPDAGATDPGLIFRPLDVALDLRKLGTAFLGALLAGLVAGLFFWLAVRVSLSSTILGLAVGVVGIIVLWLLLTAVRATIARMILVDLRERRRVAVGEALAYAGRHFLPFLFAPLVLLLGLFLVLAVEAGFLLLGRVDYLGEVVVSVAFLPLVILNLGVILVGVFAVSLIDFVVADEGTGIGRTIGSLLGLVRRSPGLLVAYMTVSLAASLLVLLACLYLVTASISMTSALVGLGMGPGKAISLFSGLPIPLGDLIPGLPLGSMGGQFGGGPTATVTIARVVVGASLLGLMLFVMAIPQTFYMSSVCAAYLQLRREAEEKDVRSGSEGGAGAGRTGRGRACWQCGSMLAPDQSYCPTCGQMQR